MREDRVHQLFFSGFQVHRDHIALDQFRDFRANHMCAEQLPGLLVKDDLNQALVFPQRDRFAVPHEGKAADPHVHFLLFRSLLG